MRQMSADALRDADVVQQPAEIRAGPLGRRRLERIGKRQRDVGDALGVADVLALGEVERLAEGHG